MITLPLYRQVARPGVPEADEVEPSEALQRPVPGRPLQLHQIRHALLVGHEVQDDHLVLVRTEPKPQRSCWTKILRLWVTRVAKGRRTSCGDSIALD